MILLRDSPISGVVLVSTGLLNMGKLSVDRDHVKTWINLNANDELAYAA